MCKHIFTFLYFRVNIYAFMFVHTHTYLKTPLVSTSLPAPVVACMHESWHITNMSCHAPHSKKCRTNHKWHMAHKKCLHLAFCSCCYRAAHLLLPSCSLSDMRPAKKLLFLVQKFYFRLIPKNYREYHRYSRTKFEGKTGVTADRDKIQFKLVNSSSIFNRTRTT